MILIVAITVVGCSN